MFVFCGYRRKPTRQGSHIIFFPTVLWLHLWQYFNKELKQKTNLLACILRSFSMVAVCCPLPSLHQQQPIHPVKQRSNATVLRNGLTVVRLALPRIPLEIPSQNYTWLESQCRTDLALYNSTLFLECLSLTSKARGGCEDQAEGPSWLGSVNLAQEVKTQERKEAEKKGCACVCIENRVAAQQGARGGNVEVLRSSLPESICF